MRRADQERNQHPNKMPNGAAEAKGAWDRVAIMDRAAVAAALEVAVSTSDVERIKLLLRRVSDIDVAGSQQATAPKAPEQPTDVHGKVLVTPNGNRSSSNNSSSRSGGDRGGGGGGGVRAAPRDLREWLARGGFSAAVVAALTEDAGAECVEDLRFLDDEDLEFLGVSEAARVQLREAESACHAYAKLHPHLPLAIF